MPLKLYYSPVSPPSRAVLLTLFNLGVEFEIKIINLAAGDHKTDEFAKINPERKVPAVDDDGFMLNESRAIIGYLVDSKSPDHSLYPTDAKLRYVINQRLYFDATVFSERLGAAMRPVMRGQTAISQEGKDAIAKALETMEGYLEGQEWFSGNENVSIADLSLLAAFSTLYHVGLDLGDYPNLAAWYERCAALPGFSENEKGSKMFASFIKGKLTEPY